jgi:hypothetical protein
MAGSPASGTLTTPVAGQLRVTDCCRVLPRKPMILLISLRCSTPLPGSGRGKTRQRRGCRAQRTDACAPRRLDDGGRLGAATDQQQSAVRPADLGCASAAAPANSSASSGPRATRGRGIMRGRCACSACPCATKSAGVMRAGQRPGPILSGRIRGMTAPSGAVAGKKPPLPKSP